MIMTFSRQNEAGSARAHYIVLGKSPILVLETEALYSLSG